MRWLGFNGADECLVLERPMTPLYSEVFGVIRSAQRRRVNKPREEGAMSGTITAKNVLTHPYFSMICFFSLLFVLPRYGDFPVMVGCASVLSAYVLVLPEQFRSRSDSMMTATCLVAAMWVGAAGITAMTLMRDIRH